MLLLLLLWLLLAPGPLLWVLPLVPFVLLALLVPVPLLLPPPLPLLLLRKLSPFKPPLPGPGTPVPGATPFGRLTLPFDVSGVDAFRPVLRFSDEWIDGPEAPADDGWEELFEPLLPLWLLLVKQNKRDRERERERDL